MQAVDPVVRWRVPAAILFWTCIGLVFALPVLDHGSDWRVPLSTSLAQWWAWGLLVPLIVGVDRRLPFSKVQPERRLAAQLVLGLLFSVLHVAVRAPLAALLAATPWSHPAQRAGFGAFTGESLLWSMLVYCLILGGWWAYHARQLHMAAELRIERMERNVTEARLNALRLQLDPHFLFNTLNTISAQVQDEPALARQMIETLGDLLRLSLDPKSRAEIALADELDFLDLYLSIQTIRFGDRLRVVRDIAPAVRQAAVPSLFLQPLVENAIRHGIARRAAGGTITIAAQCQDGTLIVTVSDDGVGMGPALPSEGLGLRLTRERLAGFHPEGSTDLKIANQPAGGVQVALRLPFRLMAAARIGELHGAA